MRDDLLADLGPEGEREASLRFQQEARAAARLSHPGIATIHRIGEEDGRPFIAMERLDGEPLERLLASGAPLPLGLVEGSPDRDRRHRGGPPRLAVLRRERGGELPRAHVAQNGEEKSRSWAFGAIEAATSYEGFVRIGPRKGFHLVLVEETPEGFEVILP